MTFTDFVLAIGLLALGVIALWLLCEGASVARRAWQMARTRRFVRRQDAEWARRQR